MGVYFLSRVDEKNIYVFARSGRGIVTPLGACGVMRSFSSKADLKYPNLIRSTKLRKQIETISQLLNLSENELLQLCNFVGHRYDVHLDFYRLPSDVIQIAKVGKILLAAEEGTALPVKNCSPDDLMFTEAGRLCFILNNIVIWENERFC